MGLRIFFAVLAVCFAATGVLFYRQMTIELTKIRKTAEDFYGGEGGMEMPLMGRQRADDDDE